jgi:restriction endonuclease
LSLDEKVRFIFSHSALREGWDNPNVFVLGMLKKSDNSVSRRQEIGRGLRLSVDQHGERTDSPLTVHEINELTVVTDESYTAFVDGLQRELSESPGSRPPLPADGRRAKRSKLLSENPGRVELFARAVEFDSDVLSVRSVRALDDHLKVEALRYVVQTGEQRAPGLTDGPSFTATFTSTHAATGQASSLVQYDLLGEIASKTQLTRRTVASIFSRISPATFAQYRQNPEQFITESVRLINAQKTEVIGEGTGRAAAPFLRQGAPSCLLRRFGEGCSSAAGEHVTDQHPRSP